MLNLIRDLYAATPWARRAHRARMARAHDAYMRAARANARDRAWGALHPNVRLY